VTARDRLRARPEGPALVALNTDRGHYLHADHAELAGGFLLVVVDGETRAYPPAAIHRVKWLVEVVERAA
jgi:hypothetical protein